MPHILTSNHNQIITPSTVDGVTFLYVATSFKEDKICVKVDDKYFLLTKIKKNGNYLIKLDSTTRVTPVSLGKKALKAYMKLSKAQIIFSNIDNKKSKLEPEKKYLKDINYFVNDFKTDKEICVEVGFGSGRHLLYQAKKNPDTLFIGIEIHTPSIEQMLKQVKLENITNILAINYDARLFLEFLQSNSVSRIFVHFPVPWDKKPHRRVISKEFIDESLRVLKPNGSLELRTDSLNYYEYSKNLLSKYKKQKVVIEKNKDLAISSKYEDRWKKQGKDIWDLTIYANELSKNIKIDKDFSFNINNNFSLDNLDKKLLKKPIVLDSFVVHFRDIFYINNTKALLHLTFGSFNKPIVKYIVIDKKTAKYFQSNPIPTKANRLAHKLIEEYLNKATS